MCFWKDVALPMSDQHRVMASHHSPKVVPNALEDSLGQPVRVLLDLFMKLSVLGVQEPEVRGSLGVIFAYFYYFNNTFVTQFCIG